MSQNPKIYRGTDATVTLSVHGYDFSSATEWPVIIMTFRQGRQIIDVDRDHLTIAKSSDGCTIRTQLTQDQTLSLDAHQVLVQVRAKDANGSAIASPIAFLGVGAILRDGKI